MDTDQVEQKESGKNKYKTIFQEYVECYGKPPSEMIVRKNPNELWGLQEDILKHAAGKGKEAKHSVEEIYKVLAEHNIFVLENFDETLKAYEAGGMCKKAVSEKIGKFQRVLVGSVEFYQAELGLSQGEAQFHQWMVLGHEAGHAIDEKAYPDIPFWETEIRQQMFNLKYARAVGDKELENYEKEFFDEVERYGIKIN